MKVIHSAETEKVIQILTQYHTLVAGFSISNQSKVFLKEQFEENASKGKMYTHVPHPINVFEHLGTESN